VARKNGHEMAGILLVFLIIFSSSEGKIVLDKEMGEERCSAFIHVMELLLMLEHFCKSDVHNKSTIRFIKKRIPILLNTIKNTINREERNGMKIIKFHLITNFADDILRFGSMNNYDSCIGERHHATEVKDPAKMTQRRRNSFEYQTGLRYFERRCINIAKNEISKTVLGKMELNEDVNENKNNNLHFNHFDNKFYKKNSKTKKYIECHWIDKHFQCQLTEICKNLLLDGNCDPPLKFFTQHNRDDFIFHGDPDYDNKSPWYDWANVKWDQYETVPAKILLFIDLNANFKKEFTIGSSCVSEPGYYAISYTFQSSPKEKGHKISRLVDYGKLMLDRKNEPEICLFAVDCIESPCISVPYNTTDSIITSKEWLILKSSKDWYNMLLEVLKN
jgi:hypothetical protein